jgi:hypothetical protein
MASPAITRSPRSTLAEPDRLLPAFSGTIRTGSSYAALQLGLLSFGFAALVAYMMGAPDESEDAHRRGALPDRRLPGLAS